MKAVSTLLLIASTALALAAESPAPQAVPQPLKLTVPAALNANVLIQERLSMIDAKLAAKDYPAAIRLAIDLFSLNASNCRGIDTHIVTFRDDGGNEIVAHTRLDQIVVFDPRQVAFKNARYLVSVLAHELVHCDQNQKMFAMAVANDKDLAPLKDKVPLLRTFADLDELATLALKDTPVKAEANAKFKSAAAKHGLDVTPEQLIGLSKRFLDNVQLYKKTMNELQEIEASLRAFELPGIIPPPAPAEAKASEEFAFQFRFLLMSTNKLLRARALLGQPQETTCKLANYVPMELALLYERNCVESVRLIQTYMAKVPN